MVHSPQKKCAVSSNIGMHTWSSFCVGSGNTCISLTRKNEDTTVQASIKGVRLSARNSILPIPHQFLPLSRSHYPTATQKILIPSYHYGRPQKQNCVRFDYAHVRFGACFSGSWTVWQFLWVPSFRFEEDWDAIAKVSVESSGKMRVLHRKPRVRAMLSLSGSSVHQPCQGFCSCTFVDEECQSLFLCWSWKRWVLWSLRTMWCWFCRPAWNVCESFPIPRLLAGSNIGWVLALLRSLRKFDLPVTVCSRAVAHG